MREKDFRFIFIPLNKHPKKSKICTTKFLSAKDKTSVTVWTWVNMCTQTLGKDACMGDSGGPLAYLMDGQYYQVCKIRDCERL